MVADLPWAEGLLDRELGGRRQARLGVVVDALAGPGVVALGGDERPIGLASWVIGGDQGQPGEAEIRVVVVEAGARGRGIGSALLAAAEAALGQAGVVRAWLLTTNDNTDALAFYQRRGWHLVALHPGAVDEARRLLKPAIAAVAENGIPIRDELVLAKDL